MFVIYLNVFDSSGGTHSVMNDTQSDPLTMTRTPHHCVRHLFGTKKQTSSIEYHFKSNTENDLIPSGRQSALLLLY